METARERILYFIKNQNIKPVDFLSKTGLKKGFLDASHSKSGATDIYLSKILEVYPNLSAKWLLTGHGEMINGISGNDNITRIAMGIHTMYDPLSDFESDKAVISNLNELIFFQRNRINELEKQVEDLTQQLEAREKHTK